MNNMDSSLRPERNCYREKEKSTIRPTMLEQLKDKISRQYFRLRILGINLNTFFPPNKPVQAVTLKNGYVIYLRNANAIFIDTTQIVVPTLKLLWQYPGIVNTLTVSEEASEYVLKGADLLSAALESISGTYFSPCFTVCDIVNSDD